MAAKEEKATTYFEIETVNATQETQGAKKKKKIKLVI